MNAQLPNSHSFGLRLCALGFRRQISRAMSPRGGARSIQRGGHFVPAAIMAREVLGGDADGEEWSYNGIGAPCAQCGRRFPHKHFRALRRGGAHASGGFGNDQESDDEDER